VRSVRIKVGALAGVVPESLEFSYNAIIAETPLAHSTLEIHSLPFVLLCNQCGRTTSRESGVAVCEECESNDTKILSGTELHVVEIELLDG
jgi:hydrogenase nickel incorporation protein HypA/HybF